MSLKAWAVKALAWLVFFALFTVGHPCLLQPAWRELWQSCEKQMSRLGLPFRVKSFLHEHAMKYEPDEVIIDGNRVACYHRKNFSNYMARALRHSMQLGNKQTTMKVLAHQKAASFKSNEKKKTIPSEIETYSSSWGRPWKWRECTCSSGCHPCCVLVNIAGDDECFSMLCKSRFGYCL
eukprot:gb/GEZJ01002282.1/.p1 GENE.gb/GEZJ01002282.1/~~gb/GEZJ01002282.1/.p1  ORF type:complete len:179 (-),score=17.28 gb/GEZJ01002282.1/:636-1172(-)